MASSKSTVTESLKPIGSMCPPGRKGRPLVREMSHMPTEPSISPSAATISNGSGRRQIRRPPRPACSTATTMKPTIITGRFSWSAAADT